MNEEGGRPASRKFGPIEDGVPMPPVQYKEGYPWRKLAVGQSFQVFCPNVERRILWNTLSSCRGRAQRTTGRRFEMRSTPKGIRVWRTA